MSAPHALRITRRERLGMITLLRKRAENARSFGWNLRHDDAIADDLQRLDAALGEVIKALKAAPESVRDSEWWEQHGKDALTVCEYYRHDVVRVSR